MRSFKLTVTVLAISLFLFSCNTNQPQQTVSADPIPYTVPQNVNMDDYWAKDNLDLQRVGNLLERSNDPQEFETYLNSNDGINNLDLNGDGYVDYIGVREYEDRDENTRGLSLFSRFGPQLIQEIAQIILYRDDPRWSGSRVLIRGNDQLYGDNNYYETNWADRTIGLVSTLFGNRTNYYSSPYYYDNYPPNYQAYQVVDTPYYRTRIERLYPAPMFVYTANPVWVSKIKIKSPNNGLHLGQIKARLVKPTKEQDEFYRNNPRAVQVIKADKDNQSDKNNKGGKDDDKGMKPNDQPKADQPKNDRKNETPGINPNQPSKPVKTERPNAERPDKKPAKPEKGGQNNGKGKGKP